MNKKWKALWLAALRGGKFKQGKGYLRQKDNKCCCLGVLCDLVDPKGWHRPNKIGHWYYGYFDGAPNGTVLDKAELDSPASLRLAHMNDYGVSFGEIADWIERNL